MKNRDKKTFQISFQKDQPVGLAVIDSNFDIKYANDYQRKRFPSLKLDHKCYEVTKSFRKPCNWCPILAWRQHRSLDLALSPSLSQDGSIIYSRILCIPYTYDAKGEILDFLEISFDVTESRTELLTKLTEIYHWYNRVSDILARTRPESLPTLILFALAAQPDLRFDEVQLLFLSNSEDIPPNTVVRQLILSADKITDSDRRDFENLDEAEIEAFVGNIDVEIIERHLNTPLAHLIPRGQEVLQKTHSPVRIGPRDFAMYLSGNLREINAVLHVRQTDEDSFLLDYRLTDLAIFLSALNGAIIIRDALLKIIEARQKLEEVLRQTDHLTDMRLLPLAIGKLHDINNIYDSVRRSVTLLRDLSARSQHFKATRGTIIADLARNMAKLKILMDSLQSLTKLGRVKLRESTLGPLIRDATEIFAEERKEGKIDLVTDIPIGLKLKCDPGLMQQVFQNLMHNSIRAFRHTTRPEKRITISARDDADAITIRFHDNATGIDSSILPLVWNRFFSTTSNGTGLGLWFVREVVETIHQSTIAVDSRWGVETEFTIVMRKADFKAKE
jgi:signal transduction histidine kinase